MKYISENFLLDIFKQWNQSNVKYLLLRGYEKLPYCENDLDCLVDKNHIDLAKQILINTAANHRIIVSRVVHRFGLFSVYLVSPDGEYQIDLFTRLAKRWVSYADESIVLAYRQRHKEFFIPNQQHECWISIVKEYLTYKKPRSKYLYLKRIKLENKFASQLSIKYFTQQMIDKIIAKHNNDEPEWRKLRIKRKISEFMDVKSFLIWISLRLNK